MNKIITFFKENNRVVKIILFLIMSIIGLLLIYINKM